MDFNLLQLVYIFIASIVGEAFGSMFGGGSFFIQPALLAAGVAPSSAVANDITAAVFANLAFLWFYRKEKKSIGLTHYREIALWMAPSLIVGAVIGGHVLYLLPDHIIKIFIISICCLGLVYTIIKLKYATPLLEGHVAESGFIKHWRAVACIGAVGLGFYDGFSGAGSGILMILFLTLVFHLDIKTIFSLANVLSSVSLGVAAITFFFLGLLSLKLLAIMIPACILAGALGAKVAILIPERTLRVIYAALLLGLILYLLVDIIAR